MPYCGYDVVEVFDEIYDQFRYVCVAGRKQRRRLVVGGDFNS